MTTYLVIRFDEGERYWEHRGQYASRHVIKTVLHTTTDYDEAMRLCEAEETKTTRPVNVCTM